MSADLFQLGVVTSSLLLLIVLPFIPAALCLFRGEQWPRILLTALAIGLCLQATLGFLWSHLVGKWPYGELVVLGFCCLFSLIWCFNRLRLTEPKYSETFQKQNHLFLILILLAAFLVRVIHPLEAAYLGQSDAYTHLHYLRNIVDQGCLINPAYPAGYHWVLALPVLVFSIDPYVVVRFGGAFFGVGLVLAIYVLLEQLFSKRAAIIGSFCSASFPPMTLLMKTGVGAFANQLGLFLVPVIFLFYVLVINAEKKKADTGGILLLALCGLTATVAMMLLHVFVIFCLERFVMLFKAPRMWFSKTLRIALIIFPAICLLLFHVTQVGPSQRFQTANILMEYGDKKQPIAEKMNAKIKEEADKYSPKQKMYMILVAESPYFKLLFDYFSIKRNGFGNSILNGIGWLLAAIFSYFIIYGFISVKISYLLIGFWGGLTSVQAATGFLQFSSYQREGWSLLIATCCMCGILASWIIQVALKHRYFQIGIVAMMVITCLLALLSPPKHAPIRSSAEDLIIRSIRFFGKTTSAVSSACMDQSSVLCQVEKLLVDDVPLTLVTRSFTGWRNQGEIAPNVLQQKSALNVITIAGNKGIGKIFEPGNQYIILIDKQVNLTGSQMISAFAMVTPSMVTATMKQQAYLYKTNMKIEEYIGNLSHSQWQVHEVPLSSNLDAFVVIPLSTLE
jgi:4-amino-4-deoxy-L-arabinose transferase-like glycosyltransferase